MEKFSFSRVTACAVAFVVLLAASSCVNSKYELSEKNMDLNVTVFQEGVSLPLGSTVAMRLDAILEKAGLKEDLEKYFSTDADGAYALSVKDTKDMSGDLAGLADIINLDAVNIDKTFDFSLEDVDLSDVKIPQVNEPYEKSLSELITLPDVTLPDFGTHETVVPAGLSDFQVDLGPINSRLAENLENLDVEDTLAALPASYQPTIGAPEVIIDIERDKALLQQYGIKVYDEFTFEEALEFVIDCELPQNISNVSEISFVKGAKMIVEAKIGKSFFCEGTIDPTIHVNLSDLFHIVDADEDPVHPDEIDKHLEFGATAGSSAKAEFGIESLVIKETDIVHEGGKLRLYKPVRLVPKCKIHYVGVKASTALMPENPLVSIELDINFEKLEIGDIVFDAEIESIDVDEKVSLKTNTPLEIPEQVEGISNIDFKEGSGVGLEVSVENPVDNLALNLEALEIRFPDSFTLEAGEGYELQQNKVIIGAGNIAAGFSKFIKIRSYNLPAAVNGQVNINEEISVIAKAGAAGKGLKLSSIPTSVADDMKIKVSATPELEFDDCVINIGRTGFDVDMTVVEINQPLPPAVADLSIIPVYLAEVDGKQPTVSIDVELPDLKAILGADTSLEVVPSEKGLGLYFPEMLKFSESVKSDPLYNFNLHALEFTQETGFQDVSFPIDKLEIVPEDGCAKGNISLKGGVSLTGGTITYKQIQKLRDDKSAKVLIHARVPELVPSAAGIEGYEMPTGRMEYGFDMLKDVQIPDMLEQLTTIELDNVKMFMDVDASSLPSLGKDGTLSFDMEIALPSFVVLDKEDERVTNNVLKIELVGRSVEGQNGVVFDMEPVNIVGMDLSRIDLGSDDLSGEKVVMSGNVRLKNVELDSEWFGKKYEVAIQAAIKSDKEYAQGEAEVIDIKTVKGRVNYGIEPVKESVDLSEVFESLNGENVDATIDISRFYLALDMTTNLGVSAKADFKVTPVFDGVPDENKALVSEGELVISGSPRSEDIVTTGFWISNTDQGMPAGYKFIEMDILGMIKDMPESIMLELSAGTDTDKECVFEPGAEYVLKAQYAAGIPLAFGEQFNVTYSDRIDDIPEELSMILNYGSLGLGGVIESSLPFNLDMTVDLLDSDGRVIPVTNEGGKMKVSSCDMSGNPVKTPVKFVLGKAKDVVVSDISAIQIEFTIDSKNAVGVALRPDSFIRVESLYALIPEGLTLDLKDIAVEDEEEGENN